MGFFCFLILPFAASVFVIQQEPRRRALLSLLFCYSAEISSSCSFVASVCHSVGISPLCIIQNATTGFLLNDKQKRQKGSEKSHNLLKNSCCIDFKSHRFHPFFVSIFQNHPLCQRMFKHLIHRPNSPHRHIVFLQ
jgi:hypothetical protein